ncbi:hypothetical protein [Streptomyces violaceusniger]|uniref:Uncharacterized protein n=1 Tax=Streptomyces violaceusniger (strain Tu 4113) TaxID=653045 RepID=G2PHC6_STRV4|nr:hypothetical protein [Streptomyces violaceusniger]AEM88772.1 hypothetical protein Strvi_9525 [Streptomyces violaceusniger Tu 4113]
MTQASTPDWGTVPTWISAVVTTLALLVTFVVFLHDRRQRHRADALRVACHSRAVMSDEGPESEVTVRNTAERPIQHVRVSLWYWRDEIPGRTESFELVIEPGGKITKTFLGTALEVIFTDSAGHSWVKEFRDQALRPNTRRRDRERIREGTWALEEYIGTGELSDEEAKQMFTTRYRAPWVGSIWHDAPPQLPWWLRVRHVLDPRGKAARLWSPLLRWKAGRREKKFMRHIKSYMQKQNGNSPSA